jgi:hypothetical protein
MSDAFGHIAPTTSASRCVKKHIKILISFSNSDFSQPTPLTWSFQSHAPPYIYILCPPHTHFPTNKMRFSSIFFALPLVASAFAAPTSVELPSVRSVKARHQGSCAPAKPAPVTALPVVGGGLDVISIVTELQTSIVSRFASHCTY